MPLFFLLAAVMVILVLALLLPSLVKQRQRGNDPDRSKINTSIARSQLADLETRLADGELADSEFQAERHRLEKDLAADLSLDATRENSDRGGWLLWPLTAFVPVMAGLLYLTVGTPTAIDPANHNVAVAASSEQPAGQAQPQQAPDVGEVIKRIKERLVEQPDDATAWFMLGRAHMAEGEFDAAVTAIRQSLTIDDSNPEVVIRLADAVAMSQGGSMAGEPETLLHRALKQQPENPQGLWLMGMAQSERGDQQSAITTWKRLLPLLQGDQRAQQEVTQLILRAERIMGEESQLSNASATSEPVSSASASDDEAADADNARLVVGVTLKAGLADKLPPDTVVFVYAKAASGPPMPLAVARRTLADIPFTVELSDEDAMMPTMKLSSFEQVIVGARISLDGNAIAQPGDLYTEVDAIVSGQSENVAIEIAHVRQ